VDLVLGLLVALKQKNAVTSGGIKRTVAKVLMYEIAVILAFVTQSVLTGDMVPAMRIVTGLIGATELKSCLEHLDTLSGGSLFKTAIDRLTSQHKDDDLA
jgi:Bacteriophage holin family